MLKHGIYKIGILFSMLCVLAACSVVNKSEKKVEKLGKKQEKVNSYSISGELDYNWNNAKWIGVANDKMTTKPNTWYLFKHWASLESKPQTAIARISCDSKYWLWINGKLVVLEGNLRRGPTPDDSYYDVVDLTKYLKKGNNQIRIVQNFWGRHGFSHNNSGKAGLIFSLDINNGEKFINSNKHWLGAVDRRYGDYKNDHDNFRLPERSIEYNANAIDKLAPVQELGLANCAPWGKLVKRPIPLLKNYGLKNYTKLETKIVGDKKIIKAYLPYNMTVNPYFYIRNIKNPTEAVGQEIKISTDNKFCVIKYNYHLKNGVNEFEGLNYLSGHYVIYEMPKNIEVEELKYRQVGYDNKIVGKFECNDPNLNKLWDKAEKSLYINMRDTYTDCPDREKAQWWGDLVNEMTEAFYVYDFKNTPQLAKKGIYELAKWQRFDNAFYSPVPSGLPAQLRTKTGIKCNQKAGEWSRELPQQMLTSVGYYGFYTYYLYSGDKKTIADVYENVKKYLLLWKIDPKTGLVLKREVGWYWVDWGQNKDEYVQLNCFYYSALKGIVLMAKLLDKQDDIESFEQKMKSIENNFNKHFWNGKEYRSKDYTGKTDDRVNALAVDVGLAKKEYYPQIVKVLTSQYHASPYMEKYVLEALFKMNKPQLAIDRMKKRWLPQIESKISTLSEFWEISNEKGTYNHGWSGGGLLMMYQYIAGIRPLEAAFSKFLVKPQLGNLEFVKASVETKYGLIHLNINKKQKIINISVPNQTKAVLDLKETFGENKTVKAKKLHSNENFSFNINDQLELSTGEWMIEIK